MNIPKAIEIKENHQRLHLNEYYQELLEADNLSIEALKRHRDKASFTYAGLLQPLPGETKD